MRRRWVIIVFAGALAAGGAAALTEAEKWLTRGRGYASLGYYEEAIEFYDRALQLEPEYALAWVNKGQALYYLDRYDEAIACCDRALELEPKNQEAWYYKGRALYGLGRYEDALACYDRALEVEPKEFLLHFGKGETLRMLGRLEEAVASFDRATRLMPDEWISYQEKAEVLVRLGRLEEAVESYDQALKFHDDEYPYSRRYAYEGKTKALKELGRLEEALETYDEALTHFPGDEDFSRGKGEVLLELGRYEEAAQYLERGREPKKKTASVAGGISSIGGEAAGEAQRSPQVIATYIRRHLAGIHKTYASALKDNPNLGSGKITVRFTVLASGSVSTVSIVQDTLISPVLSIGILTRVQSWRFPKVKDEAGSVTVVYGFVFVSSDG